MGALFYKYISVLLISAVKFTIGPVWGTLAGLSFWENTFFTFLGMMLTMTIFLVFGKPLRDFILKRFFPKRKIFTKRNRRFVKVWRKYGEFGVCFLTPVLFSPIGGMMLLVAFGGKKYRILLYMSISALFWASIISRFAHLFETVTFR